MAGKQDTNRPSIENPGTRIVTGKRIAGILLFAAAQGLVLFLSSGHPDWTVAWVYVGLRTAVTAAGMYAVASRSADLWEERMHPGAGVKTWDRSLSWCVAILLPVIWLVAGLDFRFGWSPEFAAAVPWTALAVWFFGDVFSKWAAAVNRFYSRLVRIQKDRGHTVVTHGPYRLVRHPGYAGALIAGLATPIVLSSLWALIPAGVFTALLVLRTALEDRTLHAELPGYAEYTQHTQYRLLPGVW